MRFETSQHMKLGQHMKLAPRMIQSMEILQMPLTELEERIELELASNPTLELQENEPDGSATADELDTDRGLDIDGDGSATDDFARLDDFENANPDAAENAFDDGFQRERTDRFDEPFGGRGLQSSSGDPDAKHEAMSNTASRGDSLHEQLLRQWGVVDVDETLRPVGATIIGFLDDDGYLRTPLEEVASKSARPDSLVANADWPPTMDVFERALQAVQYLLEPVGVAARDARECLLLQLDAALAGELGTGDAIAAADVIADARLLVSDHLDDLLKNRLPKVSERSGLSLDRIKHAIGAMRRLSLSPARRLVEETADPVTPDAIIEYDEMNDRYVAYLNDQRLPNLQLNREYALMAKDRGVPKQDRDFLKKNLSNAQWLMDAVEQRRQTLLRVVNAVLAEQRDYFDYGPEALRPLPMTQVAEQLGVHVATVSRAVADKWLLTPRGTVPLRGFFSGGLTTDTGEDMSYDAVRAALREVIDSENKAKPLSDEAIVKALAERGIEIARRTVAKYRGMMDIPAARMRKQF